MYNVKGIVVVCEPRSDAKKNGAYVFEHPTCAAHIVICSVKNEKFI